ncbi:MAG TPA: YopX family protein [Candidatus Mediterraneibacter ornithocaccae]|nr:YopX family protein [Candidatus Mediterraneibacter ornithocaccae]
MGGLTMREILFRAKRIDNGEWVEGYPVKYPSGKVEIFKECGEPPDILLRCEIDLGTLCQYTGLTDKNGKKVFIGDIIRCTRGCPHEVIWLKEYAGRYFGGMPAVYLSGLLEGYAWTGEEEKIGNIFDNPELLKGE